MRHFYYPCRCRPQRGQALVELALVMPMYLVLFFGLLEISLVSATAALYNSAIYQAARAEAVAGPHDATIDLTVIQQISHTIQPLFMAHVERVEVYQSDAQGTGPDGVHVTTFVNGSSQPTQIWSVADRVSRPQAPLYIGVRITYRYTWLTAFMGAAGTTLLLHTDTVSPVLEMGG